MIEGTVVARHAMVPLLLIGQNGRAHADFILDTGFAGFLALPEADVLLLGLIYSHPLIVHLADGSRNAVNVYRVNVMWDQVEREVEILATGEERLLGTTLLEGFDVRLQFTEGGLVTIEPL